MIHFADRDRYNESLRQSMIDLKDYVEEYRIVSKQGEIKWLKG
jgi:hypothetical protein